MKKTLLCVCVGLLLLPPPYLHAAQKRENVTVHNHHHSSNVGAYVGGLGAIFGIVGGAWYLYSSRTQRVEKIEKNTQQLLTQQDLLEKGQGRLEEGQGRLESGQQVLAVDVRAVDGRVAQVHAGVERAAAQLADHGVRLGNIEEQGRSMLQLLKSIRATQDGHSTSLAGLSAQIDLLATKEGLATLNQTLTQQQEILQKYLAEGHVSKGDMEQFAAKLEESIRAEIRQQMKSSFKECLLELQTPSQPVAALPRVDAVEVFE